MTRSRRQQFCATNHAHRNAQKWWQQTDVTITYVRYICHSTWEQVEMYNTQIRSCLPDCIRLLDIRWHTVLNQCKLSSMYSHADLWEKVTQPELKRKILSENPNSIKNWINIGIPMNRLVIEDRKNNSNWISLNHALTAAVVGGVLKWERRASRKFHYIICTMYSWKQ